MPNENVKTNDKESQLKKLDRMEMLRNILPLIGLVVVFVLFTVLTKGRMAQPSNLMLLLSQFILR